MSKPEQNFGVGWANIVGFIAACHFETNLNNTSQQQRVLLPPRVLHKGDIPPFIPGKDRSLSAVLRSRTFDLVGGGGGGGGWSKKM